MAKPIPELTPKQQARFWSRVDVRGPDDCWPWLRGGSKGYGQFGIASGAFYAHRIAMALYGRDPVELFACHTCDNRPCCNPAHLFAGNHADNMADMIAKSRQDAPQGETHGMAKLNDADIPAIRADPRTHRAIAADYGVSSVTVHHIKRRKTWRHVA